MEVGQICVTQRKERTCQPKLVIARSIGPGALRVLQQPLAFGIASWSRFSDTASTASLSVLDLFSSGTDLQRFFFLEQRCTVRKTRSFFSDDNTVFSTRIQEILCILASSRTLAVILSPPVSSLSIARNHRPSRSATRPWRQPALTFSDCCCVAACLRAGRTCISFKISFCLANPRIVFVETQWTAKSDQ